MLGIGRQEGPLLVAVVVDLPRYFEASSGSWRGQARNRNLSPASSAALLHQTSTTELTAHGMSRRQRGEHDRPSLRGEAAGRS
jgi:hypothetical protein